MSSVVLPIEDASGREAGGVISVVTDTKGLGAGPTAGSCAAKATEARLSQTKRKQGAMGRHILVPLKPIARQKITARAEKPQRRLKVSEALRPPKTRLFEIAQTTG
ncbi:MAG: hypothetical protein CK553_01330 [Opitutia bacterium]|nr:MAG: hypothetical protein CK553_01330 [Opitutae bacterium]